MIFACNSVSAQPTETAAPQALPGGFVFDVNIDGGAADNGNNFVYPSFGAAAQTTSLGVLNATLVVGGDLIQVGDSLQIPGVDTLVGLFDTPMWDAAYLSGNNYVVSYPDLAEVGVRGPGLASSFGNVGSYFFSIPEKLVGLDAGEFALLDDKTTVVYFSATTGGFTHIIDFEVSDISGDLSAMDDIAYGNGNFWVAVVNDVTNQDEVWQVDITTGSATGVKVTEYYRFGDGALVGFNDITAISFNGTTMYVVDTDPNTGNPQTHKLDISGALPVVWNSISASADGPVNVLKWSTSREVNNQGYYPEKAGEDGRFHPFDQVQPLSAPNGQNGLFNYTAVDNDPNSLTYYRVRQVDEDGTESYSPMTSVARDGKPVLAVAPNPTADWVTISGLEIGQTVQVASANGQVIATYTAVGQGMAIDASQLPAGTYTVTTQDGDTVRFVRQY